MSMRRAWLSAALSACCACDGVGRALVDYQPRSTSETLLCSSMRCEGVLPELSVPDTPAEYGDLKGCDVPPEMPPTNVPLDGCRCLDLTLDLSTQGALPVTVGGPGRFERCRLRLRSDTPVEAQLIAARVDDVHIALEGPIKLAVRSSTLTRVSISAESEQASLSFERCQEVNLLSLHHPERPISRLEAERTAFVSALLEADQARFSSVALRSSTLTARSLHADDFGAQHTRLEVGESMISYPQMDVVELRGCVELGLVGGQLSTVEATCSERIDLFSTRVQQSVFNGPIECDRAEIIGTSFGLSETTSVLGFATSFTNTSLCEHVSGARFQGGFGSCIDCEGPLRTGEALLCGESTFLTEGSENPCPAVAALQACTSFPDRTRPQ